VRFACSSEALRQRERSVLGDRSNRPQLHPVVVDREGNERRGWVGGPALEDPVGGGDLVPALVPVRRERHEIAVSGLV
jgi:hypothetical protein